MPKSAASLPTTAIHSVRLYGGYPIASTLSSFPRLDCLAPSMHHATLPTSCPTPSPDERQCRAAHRLRHSNTCRGQHLRVRAAYGSGQGEVARVSLHLHLCLCRHLVEPRSSATPGWLHRHTRYRLHKLCRYLALLFAPTRRVALYRPVTPCRAYCAPRPPHHRSSPTKSVSCAKIVSLASRFFARDERLTAHRLGAYSEGVGGGRSETLGRAVGGTYGHLGGKPPNPLSRSFSLT